MPDTFSASRSGNSVTGSYTLSDTTTSSTTLTETSLNGTINVTATTTASDTTSVTTTGNDVTGASTSSQTATSNDTQTKSDGYGTGVPGTVVSGSPDQDTQAITTLGSVSSGGLKPATGGHSGVLLRWGVALSPRWGTRDEANWQRPVAGRQRTNLTIAFAFVKNSAVFPDFEAARAKGGSRTDRRARRLLFGLWQVLLLSRKASYDPTDCTKQADSPRAADAHHRPRADGCLADVRLPGKCRRLEGTGT